MDATRVQRVVIEHVQPEVDGGRYAVKRVVGDHVRVEADIFAEGHEELDCRLFYRRLDETDWQMIVMRPLVNDRWQGEFPVREQTSYTYKIEAWPDDFQTWRRDLRKRLDAGQDVTVELQVGAAMLREAVKRAPRGDAARLKQRADTLEGDKDWATEVRTEIALDEALADLMAKYGGCEPKTVYDRNQQIVVERERARFSAWYELFPRSTAPLAGQHGTFRTTIAWLPYIAQMGFDILYLPPIHPIGATNRKGKNNSPLREPDDVGSPWAIGSEAGGHKAVNPDLGTLADFRDLIEAARARDMEVAIDIAFQCSPDHPWVKEHPQWFRHRPDGSIRFAENPPKKYEDIYPIDFETEDWRALWQELESVVCFWAEQGVRAFRVDNPHTKPFAFWEWLIGRVKEDYPDTIFLAEAFTRPRTMYHLAKIGFTLSYTYFTWRNHKWDLSMYFDELFQTDVKEYFRPSLWANTPDILHDYLQTGGRPAFVTRLILAATLSASYGIYGPAFELGVGEAREPGSEEYLDSEKYQLRHWDVNEEHSLKELIARVNRVRRENPALQRNDTFRFLELHNEQLIAYMKTSWDGENIVVVVVNLDPHQTQSGWVRVPLYDLAMSDGVPYEVHDLLDDAHYTWQGEWNYVELNPYVLPAHVLRLKRPLHREPSA
jgi:starch synthase (maltosyl-transferring)